MRTSPFEKLITRVCVLGYATLILSACATLRTPSGAPTVEPGADTFCRIAKPITWADADSDTTIREVRAHNEVFVTLCGLPE